MLGLRVLPSAEIGLPSHSAACPLDPLQVLQAARDGGSGGGASGAGAKVEASRRTASQPHDSDTEEEGEWEPGAVSQGGPVR